MVHGISKVEFGRLLEH